MSTAVANQTAVVSVSLPVEPTDGTRMEIGNSGTVWIADALRSTTDHTTYSVSTTVDVVTSRCNQSSIKRRLMSNNQRTSKYIYNASSLISLKMSLALKMERICLGRKNATPISENMQHVKATHFPTSRRYKLNQTNNRQT